MHAPRVPTPCHFSTRSPLSVCEAPSSCSRARRTRVNGRREEVGGGGGCGGGGAAPCTHSQAPSPLSPPPPRRRGRAKQRVNRRWWRAALTQRTCTTPTPPQIRAHGPLEYEAKQRGRSAPTPSWIPPWPSPPSPPSRPPPASRRPPRGSASRRPSCCC